MITFDRQDVVVRLGSQTIRVPFPKFQAGSLQETIEKALGIFGDDQASRVKRRLFGPEIKRLIAEEAQAIMDDAKARRPLSTGALRRSLKP